MQLLIYLDLSLPSHHLLSFSEHQYQLQKYLSSQGMWEDSEKESGSVSSRNGKEASVARSGDISDMGIS